jgi:outer membrane receptor protein involved in Fe transport
MFFSAGVYYGKRFQARTADLLYNNSRTDLRNGEQLEDFTYYNTNLQTKDGDFTLGNFDYTLTFKNKSALTFSALYEYADLSANVKNANLYYPKTTDTIQYTYNTSANPLHGLRVLVNYAIKTKTGQLESGYQYRFEKQDGDFIYQTQIPGTSEFIIDPDFTSSVYVRNYIHSFYSQYSGNKGKLEYNAGLRYEYATRNLCFSGDTAEHKLDLSNLFPSASILYSFKNKWKLKAAYSRRIQRTRNNELNPFPEREHSETLEQGDPTILPEYINLAELGVIKNYKSGSLFLTAYYQQVKNPINRVNKAYNDTILNRLYTNAGKARSWGMETGIAVSLAKKLQLYIGGNIYNYKINRFSFQWCCSGRQWQMVLFH